MIKQCLLTLTLLLSGVNGWAQANKVNDYTVHWTTPGGNASAAMPIGNGEVGANVWMEDNGNLLFYLSRTDAWSENSSLYKLGRLRLSFSPALPTDGTQFRQSLNLREGKIEMTLVNGDRNIRLDFLVDRESPVVYVKGVSTYPVNVTVSSEIWRTKERVLPVHERHFSLQKSTQDEWATEYPDLVASKDNHLIVYHRNEHSIYPFTLKLQSLEDESNKNKDPLINRTMGYNAVGDGFVQMDPTKLTTSEPRKEFCLKIAAHTSQPQEVQQWVRQTEMILQQAASYEEAAKRTAAWWEKFWDKSYLIVHTPDKVTGDKITQCYILQNWMNACGGYGNYPIKFNGSIFTVDPVFTDKNRNYSPDFRMWGPDYWWQNTRLMYHPMLKSGDYEMMMPLFRFYCSNLPMLKRTASVFYKAEGAVNPETSTIFGTFVNHDYGWNRGNLKVGEVENPYVRYYWSSGLEIAALMYDYYQYTRDAVFAKRMFVPMAVEVLKFYDSFFPKDEQGRLRITPTHSLETYWDGVVNDMPNVAGLKYVTSGLLTLPKECLGTENLAFVQRLQQALPELPTQQQGEQLVYSPAEKFAPKRTNMENPELYNIFPFPLCNFTTPDNEVGVRTFNKRIIRHTHCWSQSGQQAARLGLTEVAKQNVLAKIQNSHPNHRFPVYWGPNFDWAPDQDHGGNFLLVLQEMVMQTYGDTTYILPAFPKYWDVSFKLYAFGKNPVSGEFKQGKWIQKPTAKHPTKLIVNGE